MKNLTELLDRPIAFHRALVSVVGGGGCSLLFC